MRTVIHKLFWMWQLDEEENWINEMSQHGYSLEHAGRITFEFDETEAGKYTYRTLFLKGSGSSSENIKYFRFLEDMGIRVVCYINYPGTCIVYTRALSEDYPEGIDLFSDIDSKIRSIKVYVGYMIFVMAFTLFASLLNLGVVLGNLQHIMWVNILCAIVTFVLFVCATVSTVRMLIEISKLKKERVIHE